MARAKSTEVSTEDLAKQIDTLKSDVVKLTEIISELGKSKGQDLKDSAREAGEAQLAKVQQSAQDVARKADDFVTEQPAMALGIAAGVGFLIGMIANRR